MPQPLWSRSRIYAPCPAQHHDTLELDRQDPGPGPDGIVLLGFCRVHDRDRTVYLVVLALALALKPLQNGRVEWKLCKQCLAHRTMQTYVLQSQAQKNSKNLFLQRI